MKSIGHIVILLAAVALTSAEIKNKGWWKNMVFYQIYPRSFMDSDNDGVGDLKGMMSKLAHIKDSGIGAIWLSPIYKSPMRDFGYDISDFKSVDKIFGTLDDLKNLIAKAKELKLKVILDLVPNHTSDEHDWFKLSLNKTGKYVDYYIWDNGTVVNDVPKEPNNWLSVFNGSGWTYNKDRKQFYYHQFYPAQPDLNYLNENVQNEMKDVIKYWLDFGVDGFRIDAVPHLIEDKQKRDEPESGTPGAKPTDFNYLNHIYTKDQDETYKLVQSWRDFVDKYAEDSSRDEIVLMTEAYTNLNNTIKYYNFGANVPFNFKFITDVNANSTATDFQNVIDNWIKLTPNEKVPNWVMGNHDRSRVATRYPDREDQMIMLAMILPGVAVTYYGEEIGMADNTEINVTDSRDVCRTPFQWDDSAQAGFSNSSKTWLPVHKNYKTLNLLKEKKDSYSHYKVYTGMTGLRNSSKAVMEGTLQTAVLNKEVLTVLRRAGNNTVALLINFSNKDKVTVNLTGLANWNKTTIELTNVGSGLKPNTLANIQSFSVPAKASVILVSPGNPKSGASSIASISIVTLVLAAIVSLFRS
ncbi:maltase 1-like [Colletes gigas]|uniref:maltase 1-like n=1 Tax=Colletes gigas TaxID=935657 RepID=UPI001C9AA4A6|nr:maltase 1-like [Colletes gigas]